MTYRIVMRVLGLCRCVLRGCPLTGGEPELGAVDLGGPDGPVAARGHRHPAPASSSAFHAPAAASSASAAASLQHSLNLISSLFYLCWLVNDGTIVTDSRTISKS